MKRVTATAAVLALGAALLAGCGDDTGDPDTDGPVELTFWTWVPHIEEVVEVWNAANPDIQVTVSDQSGGDELVTKGSASAPTPCTRCPRTPGR